MSRFFCMFVYKIIDILWVILLACCTISCQHKVPVQSIDNTSKQSSLIFDTIVKSNKLRVVMLQNAYSYYVDKDSNKYGFDYELSKAFADYLNADYDLTVVDNISELLDILQEDKADIAAYRIQKSKHNKRNILFLNNLNVTSMVLVQRRGTKQISRLTQLIGDTVHVKKNTKYAKRLENLNRELGGGIIVCELDDSYSTDEIIHNVSIGNIKYTIADIDVVELLNLNFKNLNYSVEIGHNTSKAWAMPIGSDSLAYVFNVWYDSIKTTRMYRLLNTKYTENTNYFKVQDINTHNGYVSPFDNIFKEQANILGWDWRLLASVAWNESRFNPNAISSQGAAGIMQLMPSTALKYGLSIDSIHDVKLNIKASVKLLQRLDIIFSDINDKEERIKFILAAYNAGAGHVFDAMKLADKYGYDQYKWDDSVSEFLLKLSDKKYYNDSVCVHGFFRGKHTIKYVKQVFEQYTCFCDLQKINKSN